MIEAAFHFIPVMPLGKTSLVSRGDAGYIREKRQFWGASSGFDAFIRRQRPGERPWPTRPQEFQRSLAQVFSTMGYKVGYTPDDLSNLFFIAAWNEWNEQCVLEPDHIYGFGHLQALKTALGSIEARHVSESRLRNDNFHHAFSGVCVAGAFVATEKARSLAECVDKAFALVEENISYVAYASAAGDCALFTGVCTGGDSRSEFETYKLKDSRTPVSFTVENLDHDALVANKEAHHEFTSIVRSTLASYCGGNTWTDDVRMSFFAGHNGIVVQAVVFETSRNVFSPATNRSDQFCTTLATRLQRLHDSETRQGKLGLKKVVDGLLEVSHIDNTRLKLFGCDTNQCATCVAKGFRRSDSDCASCKDGYVLEDKPGLPACKALCKEGYILAGRSCQPLFTLESTGACLHGKWVESLLRTAGLVSCGSQAALVSGVTHFTFSADSGECAFYIGPCSGGDDRFNTYKMLPAYEILSSGICHAPITNPEECLTVGTSYDLDDGSRVIARGQEDRGGRPMCYVEDSLLQFSPASKTAACTPNRRCLCKATSSLGYSLPTTPRSELDSTLAFDLDTSSSFLPPRNQSRSMSSSSYVLICFGLSIVLVCSPTKIGWYKRFAMVALVLMVMMLCFSWHIDDNNTI